MKHLLKRAYADVLPPTIADRRDKMGFPVPLKELFSGELRGLVQDTFRSRHARQRPFLNPEAVLANFESAGRFSRKVWGLLCLELWHQIFHDRAAQYRRMLAEAASFETSPSAEASR